MKWIRTFCLKVRDEVVNHIAKYVAGFILICVSLLCLLSWKWLASKHSLAIYGYLWFLAFLAISGFPILLYLLITKRRQKVLYIDDNDIKNILESKFRKFSRGYRGIYLSPLTIRFALFDKSCQIKAGSSKKYLEAIAKDLGYSVSSKGDKTIVFECV